MHHKHFRFPIIAITISLSFFSCQPSKEKQLEGKWKAVKMESAELDQQIADTRNYIDTVGKNSTPEQNLEIYGVSNMDSMRNVLKEQLDYTLAEQQRTIDNTWLHFLRNGTAATDFGTGTPDTISWYLDDDGALMLDEMKMKGAGSKTKMDILKLENDSLLLRFSENGFTSTATFIKVK
jgi:hypothetical protein